MPLDGRPTLSSMMQARVNSRLRDKYPELFNTETRPGMTQADEPSVFGRWLAEEHGPLGLRIGDVVPGASEYLAAQDWQTFGLEADAAARKGDRFGEYMNRGLQGTSALGFLPLVGGMAKPISQGALKALKGPARKMVEKFPMLGGMFGPREGFYSKLERAILEMPQTMTGGDFMKYLKSKGIRDAEIETYDVATLAANEPKITPDAAAEWVQRRRPDYTETRRAGTPDTWEEAQNYEQQDWEPDMDAVQEWRNERTDDLVQEDVDNDANIGWEEVTNDEGDVVGYRAYDADSGASETFDSEEGAQEWVDYARDARYESAREYYDSMDMDRFINNYHPAAYNARDLAEREGWTIANENYDPDSYPSRFWQDPGPSAPTDPMFSENAGRWGTGHYVAPSRHDKDWGENYVELIQQMPPVARIHKEALRQEIANAPPEVAAQALPDFNPRDLEMNNTPLFAQAPVEAPPPPTKPWREEELSRIGEKPARNWYYDTHWEEMNPIEHIRGYYNAPEIAPAKSSARPLGPKLNPQEIHTARDALDAGYTYRINYLEPNPQEGRTKAHYTMDFIAPDGEVIESGRQIYTGDPLSGGRGVNWARHGDDLTQRDYSIEQYAERQLAAKAIEDIPYYNRRVGHAPANYERTGKKGLYVSEMQADLEQQARRDYYPLRDPKRPTQAELEAEGYQIRPFQGERGPEQFYGDDGYPPAEYRSAVARLDMDPRWREHLRTLPENQAALLRDRLQRMGSGQVPYSQDIWENALSINDAAAAAGVPETSMLPIPHEPAPVWRAGRWAEQQQTIPDPEWENSFSNMNARGQIVDQQQLLLDRPMGAGINIPEWQSNATGATQREAWDNLIENVFRDRRETRGRAPQFPLAGNNESDNYQLAMKRALLEAAHTDQDFLFWNSPEVMLRMNANNSATLFPKLYGIGKEEGMLSRGPALRQLGLHKSARPAMLDVKEPSNWRPPSSDQYVEGFKVDLDEKVKKKIIEEGFPLWMLPLLAVPTAGILGYAGSGGDGYE